MSKNIVYIAQYFTPEPYLKDIIFIKDLKFKGWDPVVITSFPNYPEGRIYKEYKNSFFATEKIEGIKIVRVLTYPYHGSGALKRVLNYFVFSFFSSLALLKYGKSGDLFYILQSSPFVLLNAWAIRIFKRNSKILLDIQDIFPENIRISGFIRSAKVISFIDFFLDNFYYRSFDLFIVVSNNFKKILTTKKIKEKKIKVVYNWSMVENDFINLCPVSGENESFGKEFLNVVYAGNIGVNQGLSRLSEGFKEIKRRGGTIKFHFFGDGTDLVNLQSILKDNEAVVFHGRVPSYEIGKFLAEADVLFLHLVKDPAYELIIPSKLQAYIQMGKPILAGLEGEAKDIVESNGLGETFEPENNVRFIEALNCIIQYDGSRLLEIKSRSKKLYKSEFSRKAGVDRIHQFLSECYES